MKTQKEVDLMFDEKMSKSIAEMCDYGSRTKDFNQRIKSFIHEIRQSDREAMKEILEENKQETLWGDDESNAVMKISINEYVEAVLSELNKPSL